MKHVPCKDGDEYDAFSGWRKVLHWKPGQLKKIKRAYNKRVRKAGKRDARTDYMG